MLLNETQFKQSLLANLSILNSTYNVVAYERNELLAFIKMLTTFIAYNEGDAIGADLYAKLHQWWQTSLPLQAEVKIVKQVATIIKFLAVNKTGNLKKNSPKWRTLNTALKALRAEIMDRDKKANRAKLLETAKITKPLIGIINNIFGIINSEAASGYTGLNRNVSILGDATLSQYFFPVVDEEGQQAVNEYLRVLKKMTGTKLPYMTKDFKDNVFPGLSQKVKDEFKQVSKLETAAYNAARYSIIRNSGEELMDAEELKKKLAEMGMLTWRIPTGFTGKINDKGNLFLQDGRQLHRDQIGGYIDMVDEREGRSKVAEGQGVYDKDMHDFQPIVNRQKAEVGKFELVNSILPRLKEFADKWRADFAFESKEQKLLGAMAETFYTTAGRIGSPKKDGLSTILAKNVFIQGNNIKINYVGKDSVDQTHVIKPTNPVLKLLIDYFKELKAKKRPNDYWWQDGNTVITADDFRKYLKDGDPKGNFTGIQMGISPHKFRHIRGTDMFNKLLAANPIPKKATTREVELHLQEILNVIGTQLGHIRTNKTTGKAEPTWRTAVKSYVDPSSIREIFIRRDKPMPSWVPQQQSEEKE